MWWTALAYGAVADFLNMSCCGIENPYAFNVADIAIFAGAIGLVLFTGGKDKATKAKPARKAPAQKRLGQKAATRPRDAPDALR